MTPTTTVLITTYTTTTDSSMPYIAYTDLSLLYWFLGVLIVIEIIELLTRR